MSETARQGAAYHYRAHGLALTSEIELPEMTPRPAGPADAVIRYGEVPDALAHAVCRAGRRQIAPGDYLLDLEGVARYRVRGGSDVVVAPVPGADPREVRAGILASVMGALAHENGFLALHASAVDVGGACVLFIGASGRGKSSLAAACHARGYPLHTDDLSAVTFDGDARALVHAGYPMLKLWGDALGVLGQELGEPRALANQPGKFGVSVPAPAAGPPLPIRSILAIDRGAADTVELQPLAGAEKVRLLVKETYRVRFLTGLGRRGTHLHHAARLARVAPVLLLRRPPGLARLPEIVDQLAAAGWGA